MGKYARGRAIGGALVVAAGLLLPTQVRAQEPVFGSDQVTQQPRLASATRTAELLRQASKGMSGTVRIEFIIGSNGKVEPESIKVVHSTNDALTPEAQKVATKLEFRPGEKDGKPVRTLVMLPLTFQQ